MPGKSWFQTTPWRSQAVFAVRMRPVKWALLFFTAMVVNKGSLKCRPTFYWAFLFVGCWLTAIINADSGNRMINWILFEFVDVSVATLCCFFVSWKWRPPFSLLKLGSFLTGSFAVKMSMKYSSTVGPDRDSAAKGEMWDGWGKR